MGAMYENIERLPDGKYKFISVREDTNEILDELKRSIEHLQNNLKYTKEKLIEVKSDKYKDDELQKMKSKLEEIEKEKNYGFPITEEEHQAINKWIDDWFDRKRNGNHYMGVSGGGFTYQFYPTGIGVSGKVIAPDGEEFYFRELD